MPIYKIEKINSMTTVVNVTLNKGEHSFDIFSSPDHHWDNPKCDRDLLKEHLEVAKKREAVIVMPGDTFCVMQGKYDPRRSKSDIRPEHNVSSYIDAVVDDAVKWYTPYKQNMIIGEGNHESAILKNLETNILERFAGGLGGIPVMGYHGWIIFRINYQGSYRGLIKYYFHHGYGGGGPVTRGAINMSRYMMHVEGADIISAGHIHEKSNSEVMTHYFDHNGMSMEAKSRSILLLQASTYKQEYTKGSFHIEKGRPPKPLGGNFVTVHINRNSSGKAYEIVKEARFFATKTFKI